MSDAVINKFDLSTPGGRRAAYLDYMWKDHAYLRLGFSNAHWISDELARANQPWPHQLAEWKRKGIKTVVNLRGGFDASFHALEKQACEALGLNMVNFTIPSRDAPSRERVRGAKELFETLEYPAMMHCKSGSDRTGLFSALYLILRAGVPVAEARRQLSFRYGHVRVTKTGILDHLFDCYLDAAARAPVPFAEWLDTVYDPEMLAESFRAEGWRRRTARALGFGGARSRPQE